MAPNVCEVCGYQKPARHIAVLEETIPFPVHIANHDPDGAKIIRTVQYCENEFKCRQGAIALLGDWRQAMEGVMDGT